MVKLSFELDQPGCNRLYDALSCLAKVNENLTIEAHPDQLNLSVLNSTKSAYVLFSLDRRAFFSSYTFLPDERQRTNRFAFQILNKALASVFKGKLSDSRNAEGALEKCVVSVHDRQDRAVCRLVVQMIHRNGVTKTHKFTYEAVEALHALFDSSRATNKWRIQARLLREYMEFFGARTEQLDMFSEDDRFTFTSYTEKIVNGKEILKQPLQTAVSLSTSDFDLFDCIPSLHIAITVSDFRTMVSHASTLNAAVTACYSVPARPLQFTYSDPTVGLRADFTLTTIGGSSVPAAPAANSNNTAAAARAPGRGNSNTSSRAPSVANAGSVNHTNDNRNASIPPRTDSMVMPPPSVPASRLNALRGARLGSNQNPTSSQRSMAGMAAPDQEDHRDEDPDSLFLPADDDEDRRWNPVDEEEQEAERERDMDMVGWAPSAMADPTNTDTFRDISSAARARPGSRLGGGDSSSGDGFERERTVAFIAPTQRAADVRGLFDD